MKPPSFVYHRPATVAEAVGALAELGAEAKVLAGGQSLVPLLNMRLAAPGHLIDINGLGDELGSLSRAGTGTRVGALVRHAQVERCEHAPALLREATRHVAHPTIRNRGTCVGSLAHADPASELPAVLLLLDGTVTAASAGGERTVAAADLFTGPLTTSLHPGELVVSAWFDEPPPRSGTAWVEVSRRHGDYAMCGVGMVVTLDATDRVARARAAYIGVGAAPVPVELTPAVAGQSAVTADWDAAAALARDAVDPDDDIHATADYRRHLVGVLTRRAAALAVERVNNG